MLHPAGACFNPSPRGAPRGWRQDALLSERFRPDLESDLAQLFINRIPSSEHSINDTILALNYDTFVSAMVKTYAILGDRGSWEFEFVVSDGPTNSNVQPVPVEVTTDYTVPQPLPGLPAFTAFYTEQDKRRPAQGGSGRQ